MGLTPSLLSEGLAGVGEGRARLQIQNNSSGRAHEGVPCLISVRPHNRPGEVLSIVFISQIRKLRFREREQVCQG